MRILFLVPIVPPEINGIGEYTFHLAKSLRDSGADAHILTSAGQSAPESWVHPSISQWTPEKVLKAAAPLKPDWVNFQYVPQLYHPQGLCWTAAGIPSFLKEKLGCKITVTFHEFSSGWSIHPKKFVLAFVLRLQTRRLLDACDLAVTTCEVYREMLQRYSKQIPVHSIPVGANILPEPVSSAETGSLKAKWGIHGGKVFAVFGRLSNFRNHAIALEVLKKARAQGIPAYLLFIGCMRSSNPVLFDDLIRKSENENLRKWVIETGNLSQKDISAALHASDVFLFPQRDGVSTRNTTVISALAHGLPVVSYIPSPGNFDGKPIPYAALVPQGNDALFVEKALHFASRGPDDNRAMEQITYYKTRFSWETISMNHLNLMAAVQ